jgi:hypothetical protein
MAYVTRPDDHANFHIKFNETIDFSDFDHSKLSIKVMRGENYLTHFTDFNWECTNHTNRSLEIHMTFLDSQEVSTSDKIIISFNDPFIAVSGRPIRPKLELTEYLQHIFRSKGEKKTLERVGGVISYSIILVIILIFAGKKLGQVILELTWCYFCDLQIVLISD